MPRQIRIEYAGALYHAMARGDRGESIFRGGARPATPMTSSERTDHGEGRAEEILAMGLPILGLNPNALFRSPKALKEKRVLAWLIKKNTTASLRWLSEALHMGHISNVSSMISNVERDEDYTFKSLKKKVSRILKN